MSISNPILDHTRVESSRSKLALMGLCIAILTSAIAKQLPARAADASVTVSLADLNLSTDEGMKKARERLHQTARRLCEEVVDPWELAAHWDFVRCIDETTDAAVGKIHGLVRMANAVR